MYENYRRWNTEGYLEHSNSFELFLYRVQISEHFYPILQNPHLAYFFSCFLLNLHLFWISAIIHKGSLSKKAEKFTFRAFNRFNSVLVCRFGPILNSMVRSFYFTRVKKSQKTTIFKVGRLKRENLKLRMKKSFHLAKSIF